MGISTTPDLGFPYPENDEPVTNGWDAIRDLAVAVEDELSDHRPRVDPTTTGSGPCVIKRITGSTDANGYWFPANPEGDALNGRVMVLGAFVRNGANGVTRELTVQSVSNTFTLSPGPAGAVAFGLTVLVYMVLPQVAW